VVTSIALGGMPWWSPSTAIAPFIMLNWVLFMTVGVLSKPSNRLWLLREKTGKHDQHIFTVVLVVFFPLRVCRALQWCEDHVGAPAASASPPIAANLITLTIAPWT
jgi:hypothetical protein